MKTKKFAIMLVCLCLICSFAACDMELGGLVGELLGENEVQIGELPIDPAPNRPAEDVTMGLGEQLYGFPDSLQLAGDVAVYESQGAFSAFAETESEVFAQAKMGYVQQFTDLYGYAIVHSFADAADMMDIAKKESMAGSGTLNLCYLPLAYIGQISTSGAFHSNETLKLQSGCWGSESFNEDLRIEGKQYAFAGFLNPSVELGADCLVYNREMMDALGLDVNSLYYNKKWTLSKYLAICEAVSSDLNMDDGLSEKECFGAAYGSEQAVDHLFYGCGLDLFENQKVRGELGDDFSGVYALIGSIRTCSYEQDDAQAMFLDAHALFYATTLGEYAGLYDQDPMMTYAGFSTAVIPTPAYDAKSGYASNVDPDHANVLAVARGAQGDVDMTLNVLGVLAGNHLLPATEQWLYKVNDSEESVSMCYAVMNSVSCDVDSVMLRAQGFDTNPADSDPVVFIGGLGMSYEIALSKILHEIKTGE